MPDTPSRRFPHTRSFMHSDLPSEVPDHSSPTDAHSFNVPATPAPTAPRPGFRRGDAIGPYTILDTIGEGGFGTVYLADQREQPIGRIALVERRR